MNIAEILKDCPKGTKLYSPIYGELSLLSVQLAFNYPICCLVIRSGNFVDYMKDGKCSMTDAEPTLFPSKEQRDWSKFGVSDQVTDQESKHQFKPFDKVLVRDGDSDIWDCNIFNRIDEDGEYQCIDYEYWEQCIPYEGNEHLLGTTNKPEVNNETN